MRRPARFRTAPAERVLAGLVLLLALPARAADPPPTPDAGPAVATAVPPPTPSGGDDELVRIALSDNLELQARRAQAQGLAAEEGRARALPDPLFTFGWMGEHLETVRGPQSSQFGLTQDIPGFGKRGLAGEVARYSAESAVQSVSAFELELAAAVRTTAAELRYLARARALRREDQALLQTIRSAARTSYETGSGRLADVARIEIEIARSDQALFDLERETELLATELNRLLGRPPTTPLPHLGPGPALAPAVGDTTATALADSLVAGELASDRPELKARTADVAASDAARRLAGRRNVPDFMLGFEYYVVESGDSPSPEAGTDAWMVEVGMRLPIWRGGIGAESSVADARHAESKAARAAEEARIASEIQSAASRVRRGREIAALYARALIPQAETAFASSRSDYQTGKSELRDLLDAARMRIETRLDGARAETDLARAIADLDRALARPLPRGEEP